MNIVLPASEPSVPGDSLRGSTLWCFTRCSTLSNDISSFFAFPRANFPSGLILTGTLKTLLLKRMVRVKGQSAPPCLLSRMIKAPFIPNCLTSCSALFLSTGWYQANLPMSSSISSTPGAAIDEDFVPDVSPEEDLDFWSEEDLVLLSGEDFVVDLWS